MRESRIQDPGSMSALQVVRRRGSKRGFTLLELLVVIALIAILLTILLPALWGIKNKANTQKANTDAAAYDTAVRQFHAEYGYWPGEENEGGAVNLSKDKIIDEYLISTGSKNTHHRAFYEK